MQSKGESHEDFLFYHSTIDSAFMTRVSAVPAYLSYGPSKHLRSAMYLNANANKIAWHQESIWASANCVEAQRHPSNPLTSGSHVES